MELGIERGHIAGLQNFLFNLSLAVTLGLFAGLALRSLVLLALDGGRPALVKTLRALAAGAFLGLGYFDFQFANNLLVWDRPPRAVLTALALAFPLIAFARRKRGAARPPSARQGVYVGASLLALCLLSILTLLRAGMVALTGDRVTLIVDVTGETRTEPAPFDDRPGTALSHLVIWLPSGARLGDFWLPGDRMRVNGRIYRLSPSLNGMGLPNLYQFLSVASFAAGPGSAEEHAIVDLPFPSDGPLGVDSRWRKIQAAILSGWENGSTDGSFLALRTVPNASSFYPLVDGQGRAIRKTFLLVLPPSGNATSRGSSPLEKNVPESF